MRREESCILCGGMMNNSSGLCPNCRVRLSKGDISMAAEQRRQPGTVFLLVGLRDQEEVRRQLLELTAAFVLCLDDTQEAGNCLRAWNGEAFFLLDIGLGEAVCLNFLEWLLENRPTYGAITGDSISSLLAINSLNSSLVVDAFPRPVSAIQWQRLIKRRAEYSSSDRLLFLKQQRGRKPHWYGSSTISSSE